MLPALLSRQDFIDRYNLYTYEFTYTTRKNYIKTHGWFILHQQQAKDIVRYCRDKKVLEIGAGTGYLAAHLRNLGITNYTAIDNYSTNHTDKAINYGVTQRSALSMTIAKYDVIIMTWPAYNSTLAHTIAKRMRKGQVLIYQGEGSGGCCANDKFFDFINNPDKFQTLRLLETKLNHDHLNWSGIYDNFSVLKKLVNR